MSQLNLLLFSWRDPWVATVSRPESRAKPGGWRVILSNGVRAAVMGTVLWLLPPPGADLSSRGKSLPRSYELRVSGETRSLVDLVFGNNQK